MSINRDTAHVPAELRKLVAEVIAIDEIAVTDDANFVEDLGADSLRGLEVLVALENEYGLTFSEAELKHMTSLRKVYELILVKQKGST